MRDWIVILFPLAVLVFLFGVLPYMIGVERRNQPPGTYELFCERGGRMLHETYTRRCFQEAGVTHYAASATTTRVCTCTVLKA